MFDAVAEWMGQAMYTTLYTGSPPPRTRLSHPVIAPYDAYPTSDGVDVVIGVQNDRGWAALAAGVLERPDLVIDPEYATNQARVRNREKVDALVAGVTSRMGREELLRRLAKLRGEERPTGQFAPGQQGLFSRLKDAFNGR